MRNPSLPQAGDTAGWEDDQIDENGQPVVPKKPAPASDLAARQKDLRDAGVQGQMTRAEMAATKGGRSGLRNLDDIARRTPGVLGASSGGAGYTPDETWRKWFPKAGGSPGIANPPPATNRLPGDAMAHSMAGTQQVRPNIAPAIGAKATGAETPGQVAQIAANNAAAYKPGGLNRSVSPVGPMPPATTAPTGNDAIAIARKFGDPTGGSLDHDPLAPGKTSYAGDGTNVPKNAAPTVNRALPITTGVTANAGSVPGLGSSAAFRMRMSPVGTNPAGNMAFHKPDEEEEPGSTVARK